MTYDWSGVRTRRVRYVKIALSVLAVFVLGHFLRR